MKKQFFIYFVVAAIAASATFTSCSKDDNGDDTNPTPNNGANVHLITGKFKSQTSNNDVVFYANYATSAKALEVKASATEKELTGKIEDGDIVFNLKGIYDVTSKKFFLSAGSSIIIYQITGTLSDAGVMSNAEATVKIKSGNEWRDSTVAIISLSSDSVTIDGNTSNTQEDGIPSAWFGKWKADTEEDGVQYFMMTSYQLTAIEFPDQPAGFLEFKSLGNGKLEMIWEMYVTVEDNIDGGIVTRQVFKEYGKIWLEGTGQRLVLTIFEDSFSETFAEAKGYTATATANNKYEIIMTRP